MNFSVRKRRSEIETLDHARHGLRVVVENPAPRRDDTLDLTPASAAQSRRIPWRLATVMVAMDALALTFAFLIAGQIVSLMASVSGTTLAAHDAWTLQRFYFHGFISLFLFAAFAVRGHYTQRVPWWGQVQSVLKICGMALLLDACTTFSILQLDLRLSVVLGWVAAAGLLLIGRRIALQLIAQSPQWRVPVAVVGTEQNVIDSLHAFKADGLTGYELRVALVCGELSEDGAFDFLADEHPPVEWFPADNRFDRFIRANTHYFYIISLESFRGERRDRLMAALEESGVEYAIIPSTSRLHLHGMEPHYFFGNDVMLLHKRRSLSQPVGRFLKRAMDIAVAGFFLLPLAMLTPVVYVMKKLEGSDSPVFYGGKRIGRDGTLFPCWKFCTMRRDADRVLAELMAEDEALAREWDVYKKLKDDPRIDSRISAFLRKTSLDELPQLWNVFVGQMSLVGPRPILPEQKDDYGFDYKNYIAVRPGLTGLWQVSGRNQTSFKRRIYWDSWYIRNWSLWHDLVILFKTGRVLFSGSGAY